MGNAVNDLSAQQMEMILSSIRSINVKYLVRNQCTSYFMFVVFWQIADFQPLKISSLCEMLPTRWEFLQGDHVYLGLRVVIAFVDMLNVHK